MKFELDDRLKHRITGMIVVLSIAAIFIPAVVKKSNHHLEENANFSVNFPKNPGLPLVKITDEKTLFKAVKVAHVDIAPMAKSPAVVHLAQAVPLSAPSVVPKVPVALHKEPLLAKAASKAVVVALKPKPIIALKPKTVVALKPKAVVILKPMTVLALKKEKVVDLKKRAVTANLKKERYAVQLGSFSQLANASSLVTSLRSKGYEASYNKFNGKQGEFYQVIVGQLNKKNDALQLKQQLASRLQLNGFVIKTGVS